MRAAVVDRVGVEQHLHFVLQPAQRLGLRLARHPAVHRLAQHAIQRGGRQIGEHRAVCQPTRMRLARCRREQCDAVFTEVGTHRVLQLVGVVGGERQVHRVAHVHMVGLYGPVAGRDPGPALRAVQAGQPALLRLQRGPGHQTVSAGQAGGLGLRAFRDGRQIVFSAAQLRARLHGRQQALQIRQHQPGQGRLAMRSGRRGVGDQRVHGDIVRHLRVATHGQGMAPMPQ